MRIGMIGAGNVGRALAGAGVRAGHSVTISAKHPDHAAAVATEVGAKAAPTNRDAVQGADLIILAVPYTEVEPILDELGTAAHGKVIVDVTNPVRSDLSGLAFEGSSVAEELQRRAVAVRVVKAFNTVLAARQSDPTVDGVQLDGYVAADDEEAKQQVLEFARSIGFRPIDAGGLRMARSLEEMAFLNITLQVRNGWPWQAGWKLLGPTG